MTTAMLVGVGFLIAVVAAAVGYYFGQRSANAGPQIPTMTLPAVPPPPARATGGQGLPVPPPPVATILDPYRKVGPVPPPMNPYEMVVGL